MALTEYDTPFLSESHCADSPDTHPPHSCTTPDAPRAVAGVGFGARHAWFTKDRQIDYDISSILEVTLP